jgi:hypothetical protein
MRCRPQIRFAFRKGRGEARQFSRLQVHQQQVGTLARRERPRSASRQHPRHWSRPADVLVRLGRYFVLLKLAEIDEALAR